ncbi:helix-turn-helix transcriptional regulator [Salinirubrum litoreum]|uniref:Helix-turn-helix transcriptional regulator n=1 Tax=Salinirubrum litoreum TaxID=1126234 RepID=A0ABD5R6V4_9EURY|nr:helix-turn-helix transcriptional regulator [Salinirubrum litoreum]
MTPGLSRRLHRQTRRGDSARADPETQADPPDDDTARTRWRDLSGFQRDCLEAIATLDERPGHPPTGVRLIEFLGASYDAAVNRSRVYQNLDRLVADDLVVKGDIDRRTNGYSLSPTGRRVLDAGASALADAVDGDRRDP